MRRKKVWLSEKVKLQAALLEKGSGGHHPIRRSRGGKVVKQSGII